MTRKVLVIALVITVFGGLGSAFADDTPCGNYTLNRQLRIHDRRH